MTMRLHTSDLIANEIATDGRFIIDGKCHEIQLRNGDTVNTYPVWLNGTPVRHMRAIRQGNALVIVDLTHLVRELGADLPAAPARDLPGLVFYSLRAHFKTACALMDKATESSRAVIQLNQQAHTQGALAA